MNTLTAAFMVIDLLNKGTAFFSDATALAAQIKVARAEERDLTPLEVEPYLTKLDASIEEFEALKD